MLKGDNSHGEVLLTPQSMHNFENLWKTVLIMILQIPKTFWVHY